VPPEPLEEGRDGCRGSPWGVGKNARPGGSVKVALFCALQDWSMLPAGLARPLSRSRRPARPLADLDSGQADGYAHYAGNTEITRAAVEGGYLTVLCGPACRRCGAVKGRRRSPAGTSCARVARTSTCAVTSSRCAGSAVVPDVPAVQGAGGDAGDRGLRVWVPAGRSTSPRPRSGSAADRPILSAAPRVGLGARQCLDRNDVLPDQDHRYTPPGQAATKV
jgi:hypothetical protein